MGAGGKNDSAQIGAATIAGALEIGLFHPLDTAGKRLMSYEKRIAGNGFGETMGNVNSAVFKKHAQDSAFTKFKYLYPGSLYAFSYKVLQRVYKFGGQPIVRDFMRGNQTIDKTFDIFGSKKKMMIDATSGSLIGIGEVILLPLDRLKILMQTNPEALGGRTAFQVMRSEGIMAGYAGIGATITRNAPGSFFLFGGTAFCKDVIFGLENYSDATWAQNFAASTCGSVASVALTNPMDVIKTRVQNKQFGEKVSAGHVIKQLLKNEGATAFFKGLSPKLVASVPKLVFAYTVTETIAKKLRGQK